MNQAIRVSLTLIIGLIIVLVLVACWIAIVNALFSEAFGEDVKGWALVAKAIITIVPSWYIGKFTARILRNP